MARYGISKMFLQVILIFQISLYWTTVPAQYSPYPDAISKCRCLPGSPCWPDESQWSSFNATVGGRLLIPRPTGYPCYGGPGYDAKECQQTQLNYNVPHFLYNKPGSMWRFNWEDLGDKRCSLEGSYAFDSVCDPGRVPAYAVDAHTVQDIQNALNFANQHNLRIVVKSTGHDYLGRSTAPGALMIWQHNFQGNLETRTSFLPDGCDAGQQDTGPVITITGGKTWDDAYAKVDKDFDGKYTVVGGNCYDIGAAGGYALGGGHSLLSPSFGLAVDNFLEVNVITADGKLHTANACQNQELFWALRGGGGGTFGIVTSITYKVQPVPSGFMAYSFAVVGPNNAGNLSASQVEDIIEVLARRTSDVDSAGWGAYFTFSPQFGFDVLFFIPADRPNAMPAVEQVKNDLVSLSTTSGFLVRPFSNVGDFSKHYNTYEEWRTWTYTLGVFDGLYAGFRTVVGSRLIPSAGLSQSRSAAQKMLAGITKNGLALGWYTLLVSGTGVRGKDPNALETSVHPAWRKSGWHTFLVTAWDAKTPQAGIDLRMSALNAGLQVWRDAYPDSGAYGNEAFPEEPNWQQAFWGSNYERLMKIKRDVDPGGLFVCNRCVGSEEWDASGNCRL